MIYLVDVNALVALGFQEHEFHNRVAVWVRKEQPIDLATCSITELGFVRILSQAPEYGLSVGQACALLARLKADTSVQFKFIADTHGISDLPPWVKTAKQVTDGHLTQLAKANGTVLATLDRKIPGAYLIPET